MEHSTDIWAAFFKTGGVLLLVIASLLILLYLLKRFSNLNIIKSRHDYIKVIALHHFSPREKVVLMEVMGNTLLIGITANNIQTLATIKSSEHPTFKNVESNSSKAKPDEIKNSDILNSEKSYKNISNLVNQELKNES
ncbi:MAG: flagellar biosynthetic protein FliO [Desulfamplus sp.]|nr:flagellar biosynthetic protein [Candidatus Magnetoovum chiemensis]MBF0573574.1 flagellar biosynthetic protein FliO [Desulfamplus sp.]